MVVNLYHIETEERHAALREFLENYPLYRRLELTFKTPLKELTWPAAISRRCGSAKCRDRAETTWTFESNAPMGVGRHLVYECAHCGHAKLEVWAVVQLKDPVREQAPLGGTALAGFSSGTVTKVGQQPPWSIAVPPAVRKALGDDVILYERALLCMSQSYGVGAVAYLRRLVENATEALLNLVEQAAVGEENESVLKGVADARNSRVAEEKLRLIAGLVPPSLRPGNVNPFARLHDDYSRGLHRLSDEECMGIASDMKEAFDFVFGSLREQLEQAKAYREKITKREPPKK